MLSENWPLEQNLMSNRRLWQSLSKTPANKLAPAPSDIFNSLEATAPEDVKVIIIGQDPYINGEAHGLAFSSQKGITPSLRVIFKELELEYGVKRTDPKLSDWASQGVLLLNTILTTELGITLAHKNYGWQKFTTEIVRYVVNLQNPVVVMTWGGHARNFWSDVVKSTDVDLTHVYNLDTCHPQAENYGSCKFTGCNHFRLANDWLCNHDRKPIKWI